MIRLQQILPYHTRCLWVLIFLANFPTLQAQTAWQPVSGGVSNDVFALFNDTVENILYVGGHFKYVGGPPEWLEVNSIASWDGTTWDSLGSGQDSCDKICFPVTAITKYKGDIYAGGNFEEMGGQIVNNIARWDGNTWHSLGTGLNYWSFIYDMVEFKDTLYVCGNFDNADGMSSPNIAKWDGANWHPLGFNNPVYAAVVYQNRLYVSGGGLYRWEDSVWTEVFDQDSIAITGSIDDLAVFDDKLIAGGFFSKSNGSPGNHVVSWDGTSWDDLDGGIPVGCTYILEPPVKSLFVFSNELYVGGTFYCAGQSIANWIAKWDGTQWCGSQSVFTVTWPDLVSEGINAINQLNGDLYIGGLFGKIDNTSIGGIALWPKEHDMCKVTSVEEFTSQGKRVQLQPNPFSEFAVLSIENNPIGNIILFEIYTLDGQIIRKINSDHTGQIVIPRGSLSQGIYLYMCSDETSVISSGKFIVQ